MNLIKNSSKKSKKPYHKIKTNRKVPITLADKSDLEESFQKLM
jgi:hypothetical protein